MKSFIFCFLIIYALTACSLGSGTLGGFGVRSFPTPEETLTNAIDTLQAHYPAYAIPEKWEQFDTWNERGYSFLNGKIFYFSQDPEEMYYITTISTGNSKTSKLAIRAINRGASVWQLEETIDSFEKKRIQARFGEEIISKLEKIIGVESDKK